VDAFTGTRSAWEVVRVLDGARETEKLFE